jgi:hypothetical protein
LTKLNSLVLDGYPTDFIPMENSKGIQDGMALGIEESKSPPAENTGGLNLLKT